MYSKIIEILGLLGIGGMIGSLIQHWLEGRRLKSERMSNLQKEIYFKLQEQAEKIFVEVGLADRRAKEINTFIEKDNFGQPPHEVSIIERVQRISSASVYFSKEIIDKYNAVMGSFNVISSIYHQHHCKEDLLNSDGIRINAAFEQLEKDIKGFRGSIMKELSSIKEKIV